MEIKFILQQSIDLNASDIHLSEGMAPVLRLQGDMTFLEMPKVTRVHLLSWFGDHMDSMVQNQESSVFAEVDDLLNDPDYGRFRLHIARSERGYFVALRPIKQYPPCLLSIGAPAKMFEISQLQQGLVLVTGPTGSGKTTTVAALLDEMNRTRACHIVTLEDPIEYLHTPQKALIHQRQVYRDTTGFSKALHSALRQDPDVIFVGELRDAETMKLALTAAETGHLVLATLHTCSAAKTIHRIVDMCATEDRAAIRSLLSASLQAIVSQALLKASCNQRVAAFELLWATPAIRHLIKEDNIAQIVSTMQTGRHFGMQTMAQSVSHLKDEGLLQADVPSVY